MVGGSWQWLAVGCWSPLAVGGGWWRLVVGGWWRLAVDGSWRLAVGGPMRRSLRAVLNKKKPGPLRTALLFRRVYPDWVGFYPITKCPLRRASHWVQDLWKHHSIFPYLVPPKVKRWPLRRNHHSNLESPCWIVDFPYPCPNTRGKL